MKKVTLMIPCHNEEKGLKELIAEIPYKKLKELGYKLDILVIDNNSTDNTSKIAKKLGVKVIFEPKTGKGNAVRTGFRNIPADTDFVVMLDGDDTYKPYEIDRMLEPLNSGFCDVVIGSRLEGKMKGNSMSFSHRLANWFFTFITRFFYGANVTDTCTGYFAWKRDVIVNLNGYIKSQGFAIEAEMITKMARLGHKIYSVPITYEPRHGESSSKLVPIRDGLRITKMLIKNIGWKAGG
jgi:dolichol-phosphate mannosyltransferase